MKSKKAAASFVIPRTLGRSEADMTAKDLTEQLDLFRQVLDRSAKLQVLAMMALSNQTALDGQQVAKIADIAKAMGYDQRIRATDGKAAFDTELYRQIEEIGLRLRRHEIEFVIREPAGTMRDGRKKGATRQKYRTSLVSLSVLQEFGFYYEDEEGQPIDLESLARGEKDQLIKVDATDGQKPIWAIPIFDDQGKTVRNQDGSIRRRPANGVTWRWSSRFADLTKDKTTSWIVWLEAVKILRKYLSKPVTFDLIYYTLFHKIGPIKIGHDKLVAHLGIKGVRNVTRVEKALAGAFQDMLDEEIIDQLPALQMESCYQPTQKTQRARRKGKVYQWRAARCWSKGPQIIDIPPGNLEPNV